MFRCAIFSLCLLTLFSFSRCKPTKEEDPKPAKGDLVLKMDLAAGDSPLAFNTNYTLPDGQVYYINLLKFYLSDIKLIKEDGSLQEVKDVVLADADPSLKQPYDKNAVGTQFTFTQLPAGKYKGLQFATGVPKSLNVVSNNYENEHPLSVYRGTDWSWAGYRFIMLQGKAANAAGEEMHDFEYHIAGDTFYQQLKFDKNIEITDGGMQTAKLKLDVNQVFRPADASQNINPVTETLTHSEATGERAILAWKVNRNFAKALGL